MSSFQKKHDDSLIASPWRFKADNNEQTWLFKHAPHPDKAGYLLIATDLNSILFESLTASSIPSRLAALADISPSQRPNTSHSTSDTDVENIASMIEDTLDKIGGLMGDWWDEVTLQIRDDDFYDRIMLLSTEDFTWSFNLTSNRELRDRTPLTFISRHLIQPLSSLLATSYNTKIPHGCSSVNTLARLLSQEGLAEEIATASKSGPSRSTKGKSPAKRARTKDPSPTISRHRVEDIKKEDNGSPGPQTSSSEAVRTSRIATQASPTLKEDISSPTLTPEPTPSPTDTTPEPTPTPLGQSPRPARSRKIIHAYASSPKIAKPNQDPSPSCIAETQSEVS
ncbi:hypothetical protein BCR39DRAFT_507593 [Naematelia encephala]|uniref:XRCC4-like factor-domain-containing protein n=1 Tax=Naematelia encephala TaxID=71784 RepID=A0A1Y2ANG5_9TREE|nr:hypothetical protein BCR39DRAFT_507593 [Naematelia encephala]